jgi:4'-phosphopantetheinyl transferase
MTASEVRRAGTITDAEARARFVTARVLLRVLLAQLVGMPPSSLTITTRCPRCGSTDQGRPELAAAGADVAFSLAHAGDRVAVALTAGRGVGVDVEQVLGGEPPPAAVADACLAAAERGLYAALPGAARGRALATWWTRKEAVLKATGDGLAVEPSRVLVSAPDRPAALLGWDAVAGPRAGSAVRLADLVAPDGYVGSVAVLGAGAVVVTEHDGDHLVAAAGG